MSTNTPFDGSMSLRDGAGNPLTSTDGYLNMHLDAGSLGIITLTGDVTATGTGVVAATVASVGGSTAANINAAELAANAATDANTASKIVKRDGSGNFAAGTITADLTGDVTGNVSGTAANVTGVVAEANGGTNQSTYTLGDVLYCSAANTLSKLPAGEQEQVLAMGAGGVPYWKDILDPTYQSVINEDFSVGTAENAWRANASGAGAGLATNSPSTGVQWGVCAMSSGTTATGYYTLSSSSTMTHIRLGVDRAVIRAGFKVNGLSAAGEEYWTYIGIGDGFVTGVLPVDGVGFLYDRANYGNFLCVLTSSNSNRTITVLDGTAGNPTVAVQNLTQLRAKAVINAA